MNTTDRYRLELLAELAARFPDTVPAAVVAERRGIPAAYLAQLVAELARRAVVQTRRGPGGGIRLARLPGEIPLDLVLAPNVADTGSTPPGVIEDRLSAVLVGALGSLSAADLVAWEREASPTVDYVI
jgi:hypothetical protein